MNAFCNVFYGWFASTRTHAVAQLYQHRRKEQYHRWGFDASVHAGLNKLYDVYVNPWSVRDPR